MKRILLLILSFNIAFSATGQPESTKPGKGIFQKTDEFYKSESLLGVSPRLDSTISELWNEGTSLWTVTGKLKYTYQTVGNTTTQISIKRDASTSWAWVNSSRTETTVNLDGDITSYITSTWNASNQWIPSLKMEFSYDNGNEISSSTYTSISGSPVAVWMGLSKTESTYTDGVLTKEEDYTWDLTLLPAPDWGKSSKTEYTYTSGILTKEESYRWDKTLTIPDWVKSDKTEYTYTGGKITQEINYEWDNTLAIPDWVNSTKTVYTYAGENITLGITYEWDPTLTVPAWVNSSKTDATYDQSGRMITYSLYLWDLTIPDWDGFLKTETTYSDTKGVTYSITTSYGGDPLSLGFIKTSRSTSYYNDVSTTVFNKNSEKGIIVYPNPASEFIVFELNGFSESAKVELIDIRGNKVLDQKISGNGQISVSHLMKGLYIYTLSNNGVFYKGKIVIE